MRYINFGFIFLILGSIIGAGFASGKEIEVFFSSSGKLSYLIVVLSSIFLYFTLKNLIKLGKIAKTANIKEVNKLLFKKTSKFFDCFILIGLFIFLTAMIAGINSIGNIIFENINFPILTILSLFFAIFIVLNGFEAIKKVNLILMPIVVIFIIFVCVYGMIALNGQANNCANINFVSVIKFLMLGSFYVCYNIVFSSSLIFEKSKDFNKKQIKNNSFLVTFIFGALALLVNIAIIKLNISCDMPMLILAFNINQTIGYLFSLVLWFSVLTSLISSLYMLVNAFKISKFLSSCLFLTFSFIFSFFGFSKIVNLIYPFEGVISLIFIIKVFVFNNNYERNKFCFKRKRSVILAFYSKRGKKKQN